MSLTEHMRATFYSSVLLAVACSLTWLGTRSLPPHLIDQCGNEGDPRDAAPIVVVGSLLSDTLVIRPVPQHSDPKFPLQLRRLKLRVESILKGDVIGESIEVYYFTWAGAFDGPQPLGMWDIGSRRILWLRRDAGALRTACDGWDGCTWGVYSGAHPHLRAGQAPVAYAVADILLTRGEGKINEVRFAGSVMRGAPGPDDYLIEKYRRLALTERSGIKTAACIQLWIYAQDQGVAPSSRTAAQGAMHEAGCGCKTTPRGEPDCGPKTHIHDDPPY
jgi:hypothetical protein